LLAVGSSECAVSEAGSGRQLHTFKGWFMVKALAFNKNNLLVGGGVRVKDNLYVGTVKVWEGEKEVFSWDVGHEVHRVAFADNGHVLAAVSPGLFLVELDPFTRNEIHRRDLVTDKGKHIY